MSRLDTAKVWGATVGAIVLPPLAKLTEWVQFAAAGAALGYTLWKWRRAKQNQPQRGNDDE